MLRSLLGPIAFAVFAVSATAQTYDVRQDAQLEAPVTMSVKYGPIGEVLKSLSKQAGVSVEASTAIADQKVSVFVKDIPCNVVLDRIGSVLGYHWKNESGLRILTTDAADLKEQIDYLAKEDLFLRRKAEGQLNHLIQRAENTGQSGSGSDQSSPLPRFRRGIPTPSNQALGGEIAKMFANASSSDMDSFWSGEIVHFEIGDGRAKPNVDAPNRRPGGARPTQGMTVVYARYDFLGTHELQFGTSKSPVAPQSFVIPALTQPTESLADTPYGKKVLAWQDLNLDDSEGDFNKPMPVSPENAIGFKPKPFTHQGDDSLLPKRTQSDLLEKFAADSGLAVVADGFRMTLPPEIQDPKGNTPIEWLKSLSSQLGSFVQIKDGVATVRQGGFWRLSQYEIPEDALRPMEKDPSTLTLEDYAKFFYSLTLAQAKSFQSATPPKVKFAIDTITNDVPALRVIGSLSTDFPTNGRPVAISELGSDTQGLIDQAIAESVFTGDSWQPAAADAERRPFYLTLQQANVSEAEGTVVGVSLRFGLPIGQVVDYQIPLKLIF